MGFLNLMEEKKNKKMKSKKKIKKELVRLLVKYIDKTLDKENSPEQMFALKEAWWEVQEELVISSK